MDDSVKIAFGTEIAPAGNATAQARDFRKRSQRALGMIWLSIEPSIPTLLNRLSIVSNIAIRTEPGKPTANDTMLPHPSLHASLPLPVSIPP